VNREALVEAARVVGRILREGAYSNVLLRSETDPAVRGLALTAVRYLHRIDRSLAAASSRPLQRVDRDVLDLLRVAVAALDGPTPAPMVVDMAVTACREMAPHAAGFVNAVLRRVAAGSTEESTEPEVRFGIPRWLHEMLAAAWGEDEAEAFWTASNMAPPVGIRVRPGGVAPPGAVHVPGIGDAAWIDRPPAPPGTVIQDPASVAVVHAVEAESGTTVLEVGAAPGQKTLALVDRSATVVALDVHPRRVRTGSRRVPQANWLIADGRRLPLAPGSFPRVLVDAPCSGLGTLRRRPELRHRVTPGEIRRLAGLQRELVVAAMEAVAPGGRLVYAVCTVTPDETVQVVKGLGFFPPDLSLGRRWGDGLVLTPHRDGTDGMFISVWERPNLSSR
jgi:16S rRNA (cytosine967-C5)-methyltransferase